MRPLVCVAAALLVTTCAAPDPNARTVITGPDPVQFGTVQPFMDSSCGSLDCHGVRYRNLKVWGFAGLRISPSDLPGGNPTTAAEVSATYSSVVFLEPEIMNEVVADHGAEPERLTLIRKARGTEQHAGGAVLAVGGNGDRCLTTWLANATDATACNLALTAP